MKQTYVKYLMVATFAGGFLFTSCRTARETTAQYEVTKVEGSMITIDSVWDTIPNAKAAKHLQQGWKVNFRDLLCPFSSHWCR